MSHKFGKGARRRQPTAYVPAALFLLCPLLAGAAQESAEESARAGVVRELVAAFNNHDAQAMGVLVADGIEGFSVDGGSITVEAEGRDALLEGMTSYFADFPTVRSEIE